MRFDPVIHTKDFLLSHSSQALKFAKEDADFAKSPLASDVSVLHIKDKNGQPLAHCLAQSHSEWLQSDALKDKAIMQISDSAGITLAHRLARHQPEWANSALAQDKTILQLSDSNGWSVAHTLAFNQPEWAKSDAANDKNILQMKNSSGWTVAHQLATSQPVWIASVAANTKEILLLMNKYGWSVAHEMIKHQACQANDLLFSKDILTLKYENKLLAEDFVERHIQCPGVSLDGMVMKLITQGAAYRHSRPIPIAVGKSLLAQAQALIEDCLEPQMAFKYAQALYSTVFHAVEITKLKLEQDQVEPWQDLLQNSEQIVIDNLRATPSFWEVEHFVDIFCEPAGVLIDRLKSEQNFKALSTINQSDNDSADQLTAKSGLY